MPAPVPLVEVVRSGLVESVHHGSLVALDASGQSVIDLGATRIPLFPRSATKPLQAVGMLRAGLDLDRDLDGADLAIAAASHNGEPAHVRQVRALLVRAGLDADALACPADLPLGEPARADVLRNGGGPDRVYMNCSGKHAAMLLTCVQKGWPITAYDAVDHPLQQAIRAAVEDLAGETAAAVGIDGCGVPIYALSLIGLAAAYRRLVTAESGSAERSVADAMRAHPHLVAGTGREDSVLMATVPGLLMKGGAEGVHAAALETGAVVACKVDDGAARARLPAMVWALHRLGVPADRLAGAPVEPVLGGGRPVGEVRVRADVIHDLLDTP
ncbi:MAG: asparaginase [Mycobacteriales bacterium]|nr:MAG: asparaginase [Pseudonocardiales bacterium]